MAIRKVKNNKKLTFRQRSAAVWYIIKFSFFASPGTVFIKFISALMNSILPIVMTYFGAMTATSLANAYAGSESAGRDVIFFFALNIIFGLILTGWASIEQYFDQINRYKLNMAIEDQMYEHFLNLDFWRYDDKNTADLFDKAMRFSSLFGYIFDRLAGIGTAIIGLISSFIALSLVGWWLCLILLIALSPSLLLQIQLSRISSRHWKKNVGTRRSINRIEDSMSDVNVIAELRIYGVVKYLLSLRNELRDIDEKSRIMYERKYILKQFFAKIIEAAGEVISLMYIIMQIIAKAQPVGQFIYVQQIVSRAMNSLRSLTSLINSIDEELSNMFDYKEFMNIPTYGLRENLIDTIPEKISIKNVSFKYLNSKSFVLKNISIDIMKNQHIAIVGENGAGKSTLIKLLLGLYKPTSGSILLNDLDLESVDLKSWHSKLGILQQDFAKYTFATARENIYLGDVLNKRSKRRFEMALDMSESRTFLKKLPKGYDSYVDQWMENSDGTSGVNLSGGQWQRLALARNFYRNSPIVVLDEPTSAIDALAESRIFKNLFAEKDKTVITISHRLTTIEKADIIYMLRDGELVEQGTHEQLINSKGAYYQMFESQLRDTEKIK